MSVGKNQNKPLRDLKLNQHGSEEESDKSWGDLSEPEKMSAGKNQDKPLRDLN